METEAGATEAEPAAEGRSPVFACGVAREGAQEERSFSFFAILNGVATAAILGEVTIGNTRDG